MVPTNYYRQLTILQDNPVGQLIYPSSQEQQVSFVYNPLSSEILSTPSSVMRMCCCIMSC